MKIAGAVLAGGSSRRMGFDKARLPAAGGALWRRQIAILRSGGARPTALIRRPDQSALARLCWRDRHPGCGPLSGLETALASARECEAAFVAVLAVDMPGVQPDWFHRLESLLAAGCGAIGRHGRIFEPLAAIYPVEALPAASAQLATGDYSLQRFARELVRGGRLQVTSIPRALLPSLRSVNTPEGWRFIRRRLSSARRDRVSTR